MTDPNSQRSAGKIGGDAHGVGALPDRHQALDHDEDAERRDRLGQLGRVAQRPEHQDVEQRAEQRRRSTIESATAGQKLELLAEVDRLRQPGDGDEQLAPAEAGVGVGHVEGHGARWRS